MSIELFEDMKKNSLDFDGIAVITWDEREDFVTLIDVSGYPVCSISGIEDEEDFREEMESIQKMLNDMSLFVELSYFEEEGHHDATFQRKLQ